MGSVIGWQTAHYVTYQAGKRDRKRVEEQLGPVTTVGRISHTVFRGIRRIDQQFKLNFLESNLVRMARMPMVTPGLAAP